MKTIILNTPGKLELIETEYPQDPKPDEVLVKVHAIGICGTDIHAFKGKQPFFSYPRILGHELGVEVLKLGENVQNLKVGDRCSLEPYFNRSQDQAVRRGKTNCGEAISVFGVHEDGGMREQFLIDAKYLHQSAKLSYDQLALIEPLAIGFHAVQRAKIQKEDKVLVIGAGPIGIGTAQFAALHSSEVAVMDINQERLKICKENLPIKDTLCIEGSDFDAIEALRKLFEGDLPTVILDATGNPDSMKKTLEMAAHGAIIVFIGLFQGNFEFHDPLFHKKELTLMASRNALSNDFRNIISLIERGEINTDFWISHTIEFDELASKFEPLFFSKESVVKAVVRL